MSRIKALPLAVWAVVTLWAGSAMALECADTSYNDLAVTLCEADPRSEDIRLFLNDAEGAPLGTFAAVNDTLAATGQQLLFGMNAGMYHDDRRPVGLYREPGDEPQGLVTAAGPGNFGMLPNGVFCVGDGTAQVVETARFADLPDTACRYATQSGPMLVIDGELHPRFLPDSTSRYIRNGVGVSEDGTRVVFAVSKVPVTFHEFGSLFRDHLELSQALYFDGNISRLYAPDLNRNDLGFRMGPMVGVVGPAE